MIKLRVTNTETGRYIKTVTYDELVDICRGDVELAEDCIRYCRIKPDRDMVDETWTVIDE